MAKATKEKKAAGVSSEAVQKKTGKTWAQWLRFLDGKGAKKLDHKGIVALVAKTHPDIGGWWHQMVTVGYEQERGLRAVHEKTGGFAASKSKTVGVPLAKLYKAWSDGHTRRKWLDEDVTVRKATREKSMRITWSDGKSSVNVNFYAKGAGKSMVQLQHEKLASAKQVEKLKAFWSAAFERMTATLGA